MRTVLEVFRNPTPGKPCRTLWRNALEVASNKIAEEIIVKLFSIHSEEAEERGVEIAPCIVINGRVLKVGVFKPKEIEGFIREAGED